MTRLFHIIVIYLLTTGLVHAAQFSVSHSTGTVDTQTTLDVTYGIDAEGVLSETVDTWNVYTNITTETINTTIAPGSFKISNTGYVNFSAGTTAALHTGGSGKLGVVGGDDPQLGPGESISYSLDLSNLSAEYSVRINEVLLDNYSPGETVTFSNTLNSVNLSIILGDANTTQDVAALNWMAAGGSESIEVGVVTTDSGQGRIGGFSFEVLHTPSGHRPNFVIVIADDMSWRDCGPYMGMEGGITNTTMTYMTPNIDRLAEEGMTFNYAFTPASMCSPCRHNLYSGIYPVRSGAHGNHTQYKEGIKTIVHYLQEMDYTIVLEGKKHIGPDSSFPWDDSVNFNTDQPFCYIFASHNPHSPWTEGTPPYSTPEEINAITFPPDYINTDVLRTDYNNYLGEIGAFDSEVGSVMDDLENAGKTSNTVFIVLTEQGSAFPGGKWTCYDLGIRAGCIIRWPDAVPANVRTDAMIEYTDILPTLIEAAGGNLPARATRLDGRSFLDVLMNDKPAHRNYVYAQHTASHNYSPPGGYAIRAIRGTRYKLIWNLLHETTFSNAVTRGDRWNSWLDVAATNTHAAFLVTRYTDRPEFEFYDLQTDPYELNNLYGEPEHALKITEMKGLLEQWMGYQSECFVDDPEHLRYSAGPLIKDQGIWTEHNIETNRLIPEVEPFEVWANLHGLTGAARNHSANTDSDQLTQIAEWATGRDPNHSDAFELAIHYPQGGSNQFHLSYDRLLMHSNYHINSGIEARSSMTTGEWNSAESTLLEWPEPDADDLVERTTVQVDLTSNTNQFYRLIMNTL